MKTYILILLALVGSISAKTQTFTWIDGEETGYNLNPSAVNYAVCVAPDQTVWFGGLKEKFTNYYLMMGNNFLIRYDDQGNRVSNYLINGSLDISAMKCDSAGHLFIAGDFIDGDVHFWDGTVLTWNGNSINSFIARVNNQGTVDWAINLNVARGDYAPVSDMEYRNSKLYVSHSVWLGSFISTIDDQGNFTVIINETDVGLISGFDIDSQGNLYASGSCANTGSLFNGVNFPAPFFYNKYLVKYDASGIPLWVSYVEDVTCVQPKVRVDHDDNIFWTGILESACAFDTVMLQGPSWVDDFFLVKMNPQGHALWGREVPQVLTGDATTGPLDIIKIMPDNTVTIAGVTRGMIDWGSGVITDVGSVNINTWVINYDGNGTPQWAKTGGSPAYADTRCIDMNQDGDIFITGVSHDTSHFDALTLYEQTFYYPFIVKLETDIPSGIHNQTVSRDFNVLPNPAGDYISLSPKDLVIDRVDIIDMNGRTVLQFHDGGNMNISLLVPGIYYVKVQFADGSSRGAKMVKK
jgi:hypothetical protein